MPLIRLSGSENSDLRPHHALFLRATYTEILAGLTLGVKGGGVPRASTRCVAICSQTGRTVKPRSKPEGALLVGRRG